MKRGGGRRYYRPDDVELLRGIRHLLYGQGYTIRGVQRILREQGPRFVQSVWQVGAPQPEPATELDVGEGEVADGDTFAAELPTASGVEAESVNPPEADTPLPPEATRREPTFASVVPNESTEAVAAPIQPQVEGEAADSHDRPATPAPERAFGLSDADRERLAAALQELAECQRLLDDALAEPDA